MDRPIRVFKFGGASVKDAASIRNVSNILKNYKGEPLAIVVSALGKTTNALEAITASYAKQDGKAVELLETLKRAHYEILVDLFDDGDEVFTEINDALVEIEWVLEEPPQDDYDYLYDQVVSVGELLSTRIVSAYLNKTGLKTQWVDARDLIKTDNLYREAWVQWSETQEAINDTLPALLKEDQFILTQGFIGSTSENFTSTLGREGSDYTAAILSYCLDAKDMTIWKDVPGVLTADPRLFDNVSQLDELSYREAIEMTYYGAKVIHPKTIKPLQNKNIPLRVKSFINPEGKGTKIYAEAEDNYPPMVAVEKGQALLSISTRDFSFVAEQHLSLLFNKIARHRLQVNMMQNTAISFSVCVNDIDDRIERFATEINDDFKTSIERDLQLITIRHYREETIEQLTKDKIILQETRLRGTIQMVVKSVPTMKWRE